MAHQTPISDRGLASVMPLTSQALWMFHMAAWRERWLFSSQQRPSHLQALHVHTTFMANTDGRRTCRTHIRAVVGMLVGTNTPSFVADILNCPHMQEDRQARARFRRQRQPRRAFQPLSTNAMIAPKLLHLSSRAGSCHL